MRYWNSGVLAVALALGMSACDDVAGPDAQGSGELQVAAIGDANGANAEHSAGAPSFSQSYSDSQGRVEGTVHFRARVYVRAETGQWVEVTKRAADSTSVQLSDSTRAKTFVTARINAGTYDRVRVEFEEVRADVQSGLRVSLGSLLTGTVRVDLGGDGKATVEREVPVTVRGDASTQLVIDLNSGAWLTSADSQTRAASETSFQSSVRVFTR